MTGDNNKTDRSGPGDGEDLLQKLFYLKGYETPDPARMTRSKQMIMRQVRQISGSKRKSVGEILETSFPWLFAEPKYGVAMLFVAFAGLQYLGVNARHAAQSNTGIYTTAVDGYAAYEQAGAAASNRLQYAEVSPDLRLLPNPDRNGPEEDRVNWVNYWK